MDSPPSWRDPAHLIARDHWDTWCDLRLEDAVLPDQGAHVVHHSVILEFGQGMRNVRAEESFSAIVLSLAIQTPPGALRASLSAWTL